MEAGAAAAADPEPNTLAGRWRKSPLCGLRMTYHVILAPPPCLYQTVGMGGPLKELSQRALKFSGGTALVLKAFQDDFAAGLAALDQGVSTLEVGGADHAEMFGERRSDRAVVDKLSHAVQKPSLL